MIPLSYGSSKSVRIFARSKVRRTNTRLTLGLYNDVAMVPSYLSQGLSLSSHRRLLSSVRGSDNPESLLVSLGTLYPPSHLSLLTYSLILVEVVGGVILGPSVSCRPCTNPHHTHYRLTTFSWHPPDPRPHTQLLAHYLSPPVVAVPQSYSHHLTRAFPLPHWT